MVRYAVLVKHFARDISDVRIELVEVPAHVEAFGPIEAQQLVEGSLLGPFEVIAVTDRIETRTVSDALIAALNEKLEG